MKYLIGVDVGTGSVRAGVVDLSGTMIGFASKDIRLWKTGESFVEQSSENIWSAACSAVRHAVDQAGVSPGNIVGISFDATCSLVALGKNDRPVTVSQSGNAEQNIIVWMDHRAVNQAATINKTKHAMLRYVGGNMSPEMQPPKLLWLKQNLHEAYNSTVKYFDLADFMVYRSTGIDVRSICTTVCKWGYDGQRGAWDRTFYKKIGLDDLIANDKIGTNVMPMGTTAGNLSRQASIDLGLLETTRVAVGIIDAHAGGIGVLGMGFSKVPTPAKLEQIVALIGGTSSCHMAVSKKPKFISGIWGPYAGAMLPGYWLTEGGQSATGSLIDYIIRANSTYPLIVEESVKEGVSIYEYLNKKVDELKLKEHKSADLAKEINILPYFLGNRSPHADPSARGVISGITLDDSIESAARLYYAAIQAVAYGTRHIIEEMNKKGYRIQRIHACGGGTKNPLWLQEHADITGCEILLPREPEAVIVGTAMLASVGAGVYASIAEASVKMSGVGKLYSPDKKSAQFHRKKYNIFRQMYKDFKRIQKLM